MKLTIYMRDSFIASVMADVPQTDYAEIVRKAILNAAIEALPPEVRKLYDDPKTRPYIYQSSYSFRHSVGSYWSVHIPMGESRWSPKPGLKSRLDDWDKKAKDQQNMLDALKTRLHGVAYSCTTLKQLQEALPEFLAYMPAEEQPIRSLPVVTGVVDEFKRAGWKAKPSPVPSPAPANP